MNNTPTLDAPICGAQSFNKHKATLFKIDETYKLLFMDKMSSNKNIIKLHYKIYENITDKEIIFHPYILKMFPTFLNEYNFFEDDINDIDIICNNIYDLSVGILKVEIQLNIDTIGDELNLKTSLKSAEMKKNNILTSNIDTGFSGINSNMGYELQRHYYILFNKHFLNTVFIRTDEVSVENLTTFFPEFNILKIVYLNNEKLKNCQELVKNITDEKVVISKLNIFFNNNFIEGKPTFENIKLYLETKYKMTNNIEDRMQFNNIFVNVLKDMRIINEEDKNTIQKLLPIVLKDLGYNKKRYSTGIFWYGLVLQNANEKLNLFKTDLIKQVPKLNDTEFANEIDLLIKKRAEEEVEFKKMYIIRSGF